MGKQNVNLCYEWCRIAVDEEMGLWQKTKSLVCEVSEEHAELVARLHDGLFYSFKNIK